MDTVVLEPALDRDIFDLECRVTTGDEPTGASRDITTVSPITATLVTPTPATPTR